MSKTTKFHPILFSSPMVQAILEGRKTQTRRITKYPLKLKGWHVSIGEGQKPPPIEFCPYNVGDVLWVRETFTEWPENEFQYFVDTALGEELGKWKPSIHMPKKAARIFLRVKYIRSERLRDLFHSDARSEGIDFVQGKSSKLYYNYLTLDYGCNELFSFMTFWQSIYGEESWGQNPFVWVYEFERIEKPLDFI